VYKLIIYEYMIHKCEKFQVLMVKIVCISNYLILNCLHKKNRHLFLITYECCKLTYEETLFDLQALAMKSENCINF